MSDINPPPLHEREPMVDSSPGLTGEHQRLWEWVRAVLAGMRQEVRDDIDRVRAKVDSMADRLSHMEGADQERAQWREQFDRKLDDISGRVGPAQLTGWRSLITPQNITTLALFILVWAVLFGPSDIGHRIDQIRGNPAPAVEER